MDNHEKSKVSGSDQKTVRTNRYPKHGYQFKADILGLVLPS